MQSLRDLGRSVVDRSRRTALTRRLALVAGQLAADEVAGLDAVGAFVDRRDARVAQMLRRAGLLDIAHAAMHLDAGRGDLDPLVAAPRLDHRDQQIGATLGARAAGMALRSVDHAAA